MPLHRLLSSPLKALTRIRQPPAEQLDELREGMARVLFAKGEVFYNPAQVVNRDLSVLVLRHFSRHLPSLQILEALSATGLRSIRYALEVPSVASIHANDLDPAAVATIRRNVAHNGLGHIITPTCADAVGFMSARTPDSRFHVVDLDPYGSAAPFLDAAMRSITDGGLLAVTCTDLAVLCGNSPEICFGRYAATPLKTPAGHEMAVRIVLSAAQAAANRHGRAVEPLLCVKIDFYVRLFLRVRDSRSLAQRTASNTALVLHCPECGSHAFQSMGRVRESIITGASRRKRKRTKTEAKDDGEEAGTAKEAASDNPRPHVKFSPAQLASTSNNCPVCEGQLLLGGPIWSGPLVARDVADDVLKDLNSGEGAFQARDRVSALVTILKEEVDIPLFMHLPSMCRVLRVPAPPGASVRAALEKSGYQVSQSHTDPQAIKTDAPVELVWDILRLWVEHRGNPFENQSKKNKGSGKKPCAGERILLKKTSLIKAEDVDFSVKKDRFVRHGPVKTAVRFPQNPEPNWGPKARAGKRKREKDGVNGEADAGNEGNGTLAEP